MDTQRKQRIWAEIIETTKRENQNRQPDENTVYDLIRILAEQGVTIKRDMARRILEDKVRSGVLQKRRVYLSEYHSTVTLYSPRETS